MAEYAVTLTFLMELPFDTSNALLFDDATLTRSIVAMQKGARDTVGVTPILAKPVVVALFQRGVRQPPSTELETYLL